MTNSFLDYCIANGNSINHNFFITKYLERKFSNYALLTEYYSNLAILTMYIWGLITPTNQPTEW